jgi:hypothetical protein
MREKEALREIAVKIMEEYQLENRRIAGQTSFFPHVAKSAKKKEPMR